MIEGYNVLKAFYETVLMTVISTSLAYLVGLPLGVLLNVTSKNGLRPNKFINTILGIIVNFLRSIPCLILTVILIPLNRSIFGTASGSFYTMIIPLFFSSFAYVSRIVEQSLNEVDNGEIEAIRSLGASDFFIIRKVLLVEARSSLVLGIGVTLVNVIGYTSFAYNLGAGGLISQIWSYYTKHTSDFTSTFLFWFLIILVVLIVQLFQELSLFISKKIDKRRKLQ
ncbi:MAG: ABC transporter permease subunit [Bacilli bacterium]|nr:ABC transporter permease subunit [Bacilli bacterium]MDD6226469.1 ABC transporter permease subunit [Bacilli bacterium]MDD7375287.1 ABC transporter permease subunit [Bacilli bacterium]MDD7549576.1 ABC transporter permease subunit [Bacilli bacterium]MDD7598686.1 ABC transporter permease subunit [Bacilli bacterium]